MKQHSWNDEHIIHTGKSILKALYITSGVFLFIFVLIHIGGALYVSTISEKATKAMEEGLQKDLEHLKKQGDELAQNTLIQKYLKEENSEKLIELLKQERESRSIGLMGITNKEGVIIGRTKTSGKIGDNVFLTTPVGKIVSDGRSVESIELTEGFDPKQLYLTTGRLIKENGETIGALFSNTLTDDLYATNFRDRYLPKGIEIVFYTKRAGVYGDSFSKAETKKLIESYFSAGSDWVQNGLSGKIISFGAGEFYVVNNKVLPGLEKSPGGILLFIPRLDFSNFVNVTATIITLLVFIISALKIHADSRGEERGWRYMILIFIVSLPIIGLAFYSLHIANFGKLKLEKVPYPIYNSTIRIQPEFGIYDIDFEQRFSVIVDTGDEPTNAVQFSLNFNPNLVEIKKLETASSSCSYVIESKIDSASGKINFSCVLIKTGGGTGSLQIADIVAKPRSTGTFSLVFDDTETSVLANDGLGTNVLRMSQEGSYRVDNFELSKLAVENNERNFTVFSPSHPNESRWYNEDMARFLWKGPSGAIYLYAFDNYPDTIPTTKQSTKNNYLNLVIPGDGVWYFHLKLASGGKTAHYKIMSDKTPPVIKAINLSAEKVVVGDVVRVNFDATDITSGIQNNYYVDLGNRLFLPSAPNLFIPLLEAGNQKIILRVYDEANNYSEASRIINVEKN